ncbi:hypothetical protein ACROYT_G042529 [Oculina patagonica]
MELKAFVEKCRDEGHFTEIFNSGNYESLRSCGGAKDTNVAVLLSHDYDRKIANDQFEADIERTWTLRKEKNPFLFNGSKFRLHGVSHEEGKPVTLILGQTCYKDYVCTNMNNDYWRFLSDHGKREYANEHACFSDAFGVGSVVETSDNKLVFIRRSHQVYEDPGHLDTPGGHAEPSEVKQSSKQTEDTSLVDLEDMDEIAVVYELFHSIVREVRDEVNIPEEHLDWPLLIGIQRNHTTGQRPGACFRIRCSLSGEEIKQLYNKGGPEAYESSELLLIDLAEFQKGITSRQVKELFKDLTPGCKACLYFYFNLQTNTCV